MESIFLECFGTLEDTRYKNKQYTLLEVIAIGICGTLAGMKDFTEVEMFATEHESWFKHHLGIEFIPSHDTISRVMSIFSYYHQALSAMMVHPDLKQGFPLAIEPIMKQDGSAKNYCERNAAVRQLWAWL